MTTSTSAAATEAEDRLAILDLIGRLALLLDARDWNALEHLFTDTVYNDRTSLTGGEPVSVSAAEFVDGWRQTLQHLNAVHHLITSHVISLDGDTATCGANMQGTHVFANASGGPVWTVGGRYDYRLKRTPDGWRIAGLTFTVQWATGNESVIAHAIAAGQS
jgi:ketosteroid isomerase-like protein